MHKTFILFIASVIGITKMITLYFIYDSNTSPGVSLKSMLILS